MNNNAVRHSGPVGAAILLAMMALAGCATIVDGTSQDIQISTSPSGARCRIDRDNKLIGDVSTPGTAHIHKSEDDILVTCGKSGYQTVTVEQESHHTLTTIGNVLVGGVIGVSIDSASGANYEYPEQVYLALLPASPDLAVVSPLPAAPMASVSGEMPPPLQPSQPPPNPFR